VNQRDARPFGLSSATALVVASMVGTGVFTTSGLLLEVLKSPVRVLIAWLLGGLIAGCGALSYGALARRFPESGGEYLYISRILHPAAGCVAGWISLLVGFSAPLAASAYGFGEYLSPWLLSSSPQLTGSLLLFGIAWLHGFLRQGGSWVQNLAVVINLLLLMGFLLLAWPQLPGMTHDAPVIAGFEWGPFLTSLIWVSYSYSGWNAAVYIGGEVRNPERNLPRALFLGTGLVTLLYLALNFVFVYSAEPVSLAGRVDIGRAVAESLGGPAWADFVTWLVAFALSISVSALMMAGPRVYARMARDGFLPRWFDMYEDGSPRRAVILQCGLALLLLWSLGFRDLLTFIGFTLGLSSAVAIVGLMILRIREGLAFHVAGWPWVPALYLTAVLAMTISVMVRQPPGILLGLSLVLGGWWFWFQRSGEKVERT